MRNEEREEWETYSDGEHARRSIPFCTPLIADTSEHSITRYMESYVDALTSSKTETLLQAAHAVKPAL